MRCQILIDKKNIIANYYNVKSKTNKNVIAVIKSNAYGLGINKVYQIIKKFDIFFYVVATIKEGILLRKMKCKKEILILEKCDDLDKYYKYDLTLNCISLDHFNSLKNISFSLKIALKIETGLNRLGIDINHLDYIKSQLQNSKLILSSIYSHIADRQTYISQKNNFKKALTIFNNVPFHLDSSRFINQFVESKYIRIGMELLKDSIILNVPIYRVRKVYKGESVGYNHLNKTKENGYIITIPLGYADGWIKQRKTIGFIDENYIFQIGSTCMDHMMFFSKNKPISNSIEIIGPHLNLDYLEKRYKESKYQILALLSPRIIRKII
ncbi:MAG: alanine racemase [Bacillales bacterium]|nr:alanine racemase [Bacillales bacterium]